MDLYEVEVWTKFNGRTVYDCENLINELKHNIPEGIADDGMGCPHFRIDDGYEYDDETMTAEGIIGVYALINGRLNARAARMELEEIFYDFDFSPKSCITG